MSEAPSRCRARGSAEGDQLQTVHQVSIKVNASLLVDPHLARAQLDAAVLAKHRVSFAGAQNILLSDHQAAVARVAHPRGVCTVRYPLPARAMSRSRFVATREPSLSFRAPSARTTWLLITAPSPGRIGIVHRLVEESEKGPSLLEACRVDIGKIVGNQVQGRHLGPQSLKTPYTIRCSLSAFLSA